MKKTTLESIFESNAIPFRNVYEAAQNVVQDYMTKENVSIEAVASALGTTKGYLYGLLDPKQDTKALSVDRVIELSVLTGDSRIIDVMKETAKIKEDENETDICALGNLTMQVQVHTGALSSTVIEAVEDGEIDEIEKKNIRKKALSEIKKLQEIIEMVE